MRSLAEPGGSAVLPAPLPIPGVATGRRCFPERSAGVIDGEHGVVAGSGGRAGEGVCVDLCCLSDFQALIAHRSLEGHGLYSFVPGLLEHFTSAQINGLIASRTHLSLAGVYDPLTPLDGLDTIDGELRKVYGGGDAGGVAVVAVWDGACGDGGDAGGDGVIPSSLPVMTVVKEL
jgi:hypothetical protein